MSNDPKGAQDRLRAATGGAPPPRKRTIVDYLEDPRVASGLAAVAGKLMQPDRLLRLSITAVKKTPRLLQCDPQSVLGAMMTCAALGLEPNTVQQQAFLIPYKRRAKVGDEWVDVWDCEFQVGARGFVTLAYRQERILSLQAETVHAHDRFEHELGTKRFLSFSKKLVDRGEAVGAFSYVTLQGGAELACVLPLDELHKIRAKSESWRSLTAGVAAAESDRDRAKAQAKLDETPWVAWFDDMGAKSAIKKHAKQLPIAAGEGLAIAAEIDDRADSRQLNLAALSDPDLVRAVVSGEEDAPRQLTDDPTGQGFEVGGKGGDAVRSPAPAKTTRQARTTTAAPKPGPQADQAPTTQGAPAKQGGPSEADVLAMIEKAKTEAERDEAMDLARSALNAEAIDRLRAHRLGMPELPRE